MRWPLQPLQPLQTTQLQPLFGPSMDSPCHPWFTTTNLSYRNSIVEPPASALCGTIFFCSYIYLFDFVPRDIVPHDAMPAAGPGKASSIGVRCPWRFGAWRWMRRKSFLQSSHVSMPSWSPASSPSRWQLPCAIVSRQVLDDKGKGIVLDSHHVLDWHGLGSEPVVRWAGQAATRRVESLQAEPELPVWGQPAVLQGQSWACSQGGVRRQLEAVSIDRPTIHPGGGASSAAWHWGLPGPWWPGPNCVSGRPQSRRTRRPTCWQAWTKSWTGSDTSRIFFWSWSKCSHNCALWLIGYLYLWKPHM